VASFDPIRRQWPGFVFGTVFVFMYPKGMPPGHLFQPAVVRYGHRRRCSGLMKVGLCRKGDLPPPFFWALLRVMGASGGPLVLLQVKKGAFITARELYHRKVCTDLSTQQMLVERESALLVLAKLPCACSGASLVLGKPIIVNVSFATPGF
jgi:hypothetical protein